MSADLKCPECGGLTIRFRGKGQNLEYNVCSRWQQPGHLSKVEIDTALRERRQTERPSGRFA